jgi:hypothetical protein
MTQTPIPRCDCCGLPISREFGEDCPRCTYPLSPSKEERFLASAIRDLHRVITYGGANLTVAGLLRRYQVRLDYLNRLKGMVAPSAPLVPPVAKPVAPVPPPVSKEAEPAPTSPPVPPGARPVAPVSSPVPPVARSAAPVPPSVPPVGRQVGAAPSTPSVERPPVAAPVREGPNLRQWFLSLRAFAIDQAITILGILGAFFVLLAALSFIINPLGNPLLAFLVAIGIHLVFGVASIVVDRFPSLRVLSIIYTIIFALTLPLPGYTAYNLVQGHIFQLSVPTLVAIVAAYAAAIYIALAVYQSAAVFGYLGVMALVVVDLAIARALGLGYWWWPSMLMLLALPALVTHLQPASDSPASIKRLFTGQRAVLREPMRILMFLIVAVCVLAVVVTFLYSLQLGSSNSEVRFSILSMTVLLLIWSSLSLWLTKRTGEVIVLAYLFLACVLALCYAFSFGQVGYALALTVVALLYHGLNRFAGRLLQPFGRLGLQLDILALILVGIVPLISDPALPLRLFERAYQVPPELVPYLLLQAGWETVAELIAIGAGVILTVSVTLSRANTSGTSWPAEMRQNAWPWLLLLSGALLSWGSGMVVLALNIEPVWSFLGLTLGTVVGAVVVRQRFGARWANPLDVLALSGAMLTLSLSLNRSDILWALLLLFALLSYSLMLYQRRPAWLFLPLVFSLLAFPALVGARRYEVLLLLCLLPPLAAAGIRRLITERWRVAGSGVPTQPRRALAWEWPLLAVGLTYSAVFSFIDTINAVVGSRILAEYWLGRQVPFAIEVGSFALIWYVAAGLARVKWWLIPVTGFAIITVAVVPLLPNPFWTLVVVVPSTAFLALGISRFVSRDWALPLYVVTLLSAVIAGIVGPYQGQLPATTSVLLAFAVLAYIIGIVEDWTPWLWIAPAFGTWSVFDSGLQHNLYRAPTVALICATLGMAIGLLNFYIPPLLKSTVLGVIFSSHRQSAQSEHRLCRIG